MAPIDSSSTLLVIMEPTDDTGVRMRIPYVDFQKRKCSQKDKGNVIVCYQTCNHKKVEQQSK